MADVKQFKTPKRRLVFEKYFLTESKQRHKKQIRDHYFNHSVSLLVPGCPMSAVKQCFRDRTPLSDEFCISILPVHLFVDKNFIDTFIKEGSFYALSRKTKIDTENCVAVLPKGILLLSLDKDTYEELGLVGKQSIFQKKLSFNVEIDLTSPSFHPGKNLYERVNWCLKDHLDLQFEFVLTWLDTENKPDVQKLQSYFDTYKCHQLKNKEDVRSLNNTKIPVVNSLQTRLSSDDNSTSCVDVGSFYEWLGTVHCDIDCSSGSPDNYISTLTCPNPSTVLKEIVKYQWTGLITPQTILSLLQASRSYLHSSSHQPPWIALNVWGFADAPVSWLRNEHGFQHEGDNMYTIVMFPDDLYWYYMALGTNDICS